MTLQKRRKPKRQPFLLDLRHRLEYAVVLCAALLLNSLSYRRALQLGRRFGRALYYCLPIRKRTVLQNLAQAFPERDAAWRATIARKCYEHISMSFVEFLIIPKLVRLAQSGRDFKLACEGRENLLALEPHTRPFIGCGCHLSGWEQIGLICVLEKIPMTPLAKRIHNPYFNRWVERRRNATGSEFCYIENVRAGITKILKHGGGLIFINDQDAGKSGIGIDFFGRPCSTFTGPARIAVKHRLPFIPFYQYRDADDPARINLVLRPAVQIPAELAPQEQVRFLLESYTRELEAMIRRHPEQYFWFHNRWKTRPKPQPPASSASEPV